MNHVPPQSHFSFLQSHTFSRGDILHIRHCLFPDCYSEMGLGREVLVPESPIRQTPTGAISLPRDCEKHEAYVIITISTLPNTENLHSCFRVKHTSVIELFSWCAFSLNNILFMVCTLDSCLTF